MSEISVESSVERIWNPTEKQKSFISIPFSIFEALYGGSAGSGKSEILLVLPLIYSFYEHPLFKGLILRRTFPELESEIILRSKEWYSTVGAIYNESKRRWVFPSGSIMQFGHADKEQDVRKYDTAQYNFIGWDECTSFTEFQYSYLSFSRARSRTPDLPAIVRAATNPGGIGHQYFKERFVKPARQGGVIIKDEKTGKKRIFIPAKITDNPHILKANPEYARQLELLPEAEKRAKLLGDWDTYQGQTFKEFRLEPLPDEPENAKHVIKPFDIPSYWPRIIGVDWGFQAFTWIGWSAVAPNGRVYLYREYAEKQKLTDEWLTDLLNLTTGAERESIKRIRICHSANQQRGEAQTIQAKFQKAINQANIRCGVELADRDRVAGKLLVHDYLRWKPRENLVSIIDPYNVAYADYLFKNKGTKAYEEYLKQYEPPEPEANIPKLQIFDTCEKVIETIPNCLYDDNNPEDVAEFKGDDPYDGLRILLGGIRDYFATGAKELEQARAIENAINSTEDVSSLYRKLEFLEAKNKKPISIRKRGFSRFRSMRRM